MKILIQSAKDILESLQLHAENVTVVQNILDSQRVFQTPQPLSTGCSHRPMDISFVVDASGSIGANNFSKCLKFIEDFINNFDISPNAVRVSLVTYGDEAYEEHAFGFKKYFDKDSLKDAILAIPYSKGRCTNTSGGIRYMLQNHYPEARNDVHRVAIVITDGQSTKKDETIDAASDAHKAYNQVFAIGVGLSVSSSDEELFKIASDRSYVLKIESYDTLLSITENLIVKTDNDSIEQFEAWRQTFLDKLKEVEITVWKGSIEQLQKRYEDLVTGLRNKGEYLEEVKVVGKETVTYLGPIPSELKEKIEAFALDLEKMEEYILAIVSIGEEENEEQDPQSIADKMAVKQKCLKDACTTTRGRIDTLCRITEELVERLEDIANEISGKITLMSRATKELQQSVRDVISKLADRQRPVRYVGTGIAILGAAAGFVTGGVAAPLILVVGALAGSYAVGKYMDKEAFSEASRIWNGYGSELKRSGLLCIIGQEMINDSQSNEYTINAGKAFKEMQKDEANSEVIAKRYFDDRNAAYFIFVGLGFIEFFKWLLSLTGPIELHLNSFINTELAGILQALNNMATDIERN